MNWMSYQVISVQVVQVEVFDNLEQREDWITIGTKMALIHIASYVTCKDEAPSEEELLDVATFYHQKFGGYTDQLDRGQLNIHIDRAVQWCICAMVHLLTHFVSSCQRVGI